MTTTGRSGSAPSGGTPGWSHRRHAGDFHGSTRYFHRRRALPYIAGSLSATNDEATWVLTSYLVANAIILPASSWFSLRFGRKRFLLRAS